MKKISVVILLVFDAIFNMSCESRSKHKLSEKECESKTEKIGIGAFPPNSNSKKVIEKPKTIFIQPYGGFSPELIKEATKGITSMYKLEVKILKAVELPKMAFSSLRNRYKTDSLLVDLAKRKAYSFKIIGLTENDICTPSNGIEDWGIFGYGSIDGYSCVVSTKRMQKGVSIEKVKERLVKVINHEIGHTLNLLHCPVKDCLMEDGGGSIKTVDSENGDLCANCAKKVSKYLVKQ